ncbi:YdcF family protein [Segnochrobactrum spirostomi]|uniref:YdcF family protein n=1 Tax=Segnochrobactrum spirostomi TaxID=2608987 RepID=A0A6A7Y5W1_9HYPH|nr:YdcF family protein [Segnochrobactrum spirostomi]MQT14095.1 YdcF family protein [Segnochrobactrum spirostomi]
MAPIASLLASLVALPSNLLVLFLVAGLAALGLSRRRLGLTLVGLSAAGFLVLGVLPGGFLLLEGLEDRFPPPAPPAHVDGILLLGGYLDTATLETRGRLTPLASIDRLLAAAELARLYPDARIVVTGGEKYGLAFPGQPPEAEAAARLLTEMGIDPARLVVEPRAVNTWENAVLSKPLAAPRTGETWLLVTSAAHMPRAVGVFRAAGWPGLVPWPVDFRTRGGWATWRQLRAVSTGLAAADAAVREYAGLVAYRLAGRSSSLFPGP